MKTELRFRWLMVPLIATLTVAGAWLLRGWLLDSTRARLTQSYQQRLISASEREAASLVQQLAQSDDQFLEILVWASADDRPLVSHTAQRELQDLLDQWSSLPPQVSSVRAAGLARLLAVHAASVPPERRHLAHSLAQRLILWPVDSHRADAASFIADCQTVLLLPRADQPDIRVAAVPETRPAEPPQAAHEPAWQPPSPALEPPAPPRENSPGEPRAFSPSPGQRISDR